MQDTVVQEPTEIILGLSLEGPQILWARVAFVVDGPRRGWLRLVDVGAITDAVRPFAALIQSEPRAALVALGALHVESIRTRTRRDRFEAILELYEVSARRVGVPIGPGALEHVEQSGLVGVPAGHDSAALAALRSREPWEVKALPRGKGRAEERVLNALESNGPATLSMLRRGLNMSGTRTTQLLQRLLTAKRIEVLEPTAPGSLARYRAL